MQTPPIQPALAGIIAPEPCQLLLENIAECPEDKHPDVYAELLKKSRQKKGGADE